MKSWMLAAAAVASLAMVAIDAEACGRGRGGGRHRGGCGAGCSSGHGGSTIPSGPPVRTLPVAAAPWEAQLVWAWDPLAGGYRQVGWLGAGGTIVPLAGQTLVRAPVAPDTR